MKTLALLAICLALPLAAKEPNQTPLTPEEHDSYVLMVIQDLSVQNLSLNKFRAHQGGFDDLDAANKAHAERVAALKDLAKKHNACEGAEWNIAKKEWNCPPAAIGVK